MLVISLDFELHWGMRDKQRLADCEARLLGARAAIPRMLDLFARHEVAATWATVGFLFFDDKEELLSSLPEERPHYANPALSPYAALDEIGPNEAAAPCHFGLSLIRRIAETPRQEVASHTFSHYYCLEGGQTPSTFAADLDAARSAARRLGITLESLVFPRNQANQDYLSICREQGFKAVRGNPRSWLYAAADQEGDTGLRRIARLADSYLPITREKTALRTPIDGLSDVPATMFLRPVTAPLKALEPLRLDRLKRMMTTAARTGSIFHLWWHPHNFGRDTEANLDVLDRLLQHFRELRDRFGMRSMTMADMAA
jgi:peptidoglycan/xylan/chitin deacetylase (PgdA/CDA1 family)